jgi:hypothetical protein
MTTEREVRGHAPGAAYRISPRGRPPPARDIGRVRYRVLRMPSPPLFADDNSSYRRAVRRAAREEREREDRRTQILATLRRLKEEAGNEAHLAERERARRHADLLERYPPLF